MNAVPSSAQDPLPAAPACAAADAGDDAGDDPAPRRRAADHPVFERLVAAGHTAFERHTVLHELNQRVEACPKALAQKVRAFVERGVPYFAPADRHYRHWAAQVADLWDRVEAARAAAASLKPA